MFKVGDEVVCVEHPNINTVKWCKLLGIILFEKNKVYKISQVKGINVSCKELTAIGGIFEGYKAHLFRKLEDVKLQQKLAKEASEPVKEGLEIPVKKEELEEELV